MNNPLRIALAQLDSTSASVESNVAAIVAAAQSAHDREHADVVVFPELALTGCPPDDLLLRPETVGQVEAGLKRIVDQVRGIVVVVGYPEYATDGCYNAASMFLDGARLGHYRKQYMPPSGGVDERGYFAAGDRACVTEIEGIPVALGIGDAIYEGAEPVRAAQDAGARVFVNLGASPFYLGSAAKREAALASRARETGMAIIDVNRVGGQDDLVFDGGSMVCDAGGTLRFRAPLFETGVYGVTVDGGGHVVDAPPLQELPPDAAVVYRALVRATRDYVERHGFPGVLVGLSGGIDSALVSTIATDALGADRVWTVSMPSRYTAQMSRDDAAAVARLLGVRHQELALEPLFESFLNVLAPAFENRPPDATEENIQARIRGMLLMALSNKFGHLVLAPGNKSEFAVGYSTLYGDMVGGFAPLRDVYKTWVYRLAEYRNQTAAVIPERILSRAPSAELRSGQKDSDSLPEYAVLDPIVEAYMEHNRSAADICAMGFDEADVQRTVSLIHKSEYKRRQGPPGPKVTRVAFGNDRRYPIAS